MRDIYDACVRMVRADYCGDGEETTRDGTLIDFYDDRGIQQSDSDPMQEFEAGWAANGAVCVHHVRVKENISLEGLAVSCPRLRERLGATCTEERARALGAALAVRTLPAITEWWSMAASGCGLKALRMVKLLGKAGWEG